MSSHGSHSAHTGGRLTGTILLNIAITVAEFLGGIFSGYLALLADAVHNLSDVAALILAWLGARGAEMPATKRSTFGLKRLEVMTALVSAVALVVISVFIFQEAYDRLVNPQPLIRPWLFLTIAVIGLIGNALSVWLLYSEKSRSLNMKTAFLHMIYDTLSSVAVIVGGIVILWTGWTPLDAILSAIIGVMILWSSYQVIREAVLILLESVPEGVDFDRVHAAIAGIPPVRDVHDLHIWSLSSKEFALSCHICVDDSDYQRGPELIERINRLLSEQFGIGHGTIQVEKGNCARTDLLCRHNDHP
ncbi:MAG: cation diffusion facilitator family transporter [Candidatus Zixiibacteriota bacterium]